MDRGSLLVFKSEIRSLVNSSIDNKCSLCIRCILRFCNVKQVFTNCTTDQMVADLSSFLDVIAQNINLIRNVFCNTCLDTLNDTFLEQICKQIECDLSEKSYLPLEDFQLQIHLPAVLTLRNSFFAKRLGLDKDETLSIKEVFKSLLASKLFKTINAKHKNDSNFIIGNFPFCSFDSSLNIYRFQSLILFIKKAKKNANNWLKFHLKHFIKRNVANRQLNRSSIILLFNACLTN